MSWINRAIQGLSSLLPVERILETTRSLTDTLLQSSFNYFFQIPEYYEEPEEPIGTPVPPEEPIVPPIEPIQPPVETVQPPVETVEPPIEPVQPPIERPIERPIIEVQVQPSRPLPPFVILYKLIGSETMGATAVIFNRRQGDGLYMENLVIRNGNGNGELIPTSMVKYLFEAFPLVYSEPHFLTYFFDVNTYNNVRNVLRQFCFTEWYLDNTWFEIVTEVEITVPPPPEIVPITNSLFVNNNLITGPLLLYDAKQNITESRASALPIPITANNPLNYTLFGDDVSPYKHFINPTPKQHDNCIINILIHKFNLQAKEKSAISRKTIINYFSNDTSIGRLREFFDKYRINYYILDITGSIKYRTTLKETDHSKRTIAIMYHNHHAFMYDASLNENINIEQLSTPKSHNLDNMTPQHTIAGWYNNNKSKIFAKMSEDDLKKFNKIRRVISAPGFDKHIANFTYECQMNEYIMPLCYEDPKYKDAKIFGWDGNKAYYNAFMSLKPNEPIGVWNMFDRIVSYNNKNKIVSYAKYYLKRNIKEKIPWQSNNIMLGFRLKYYLNMGILTKDDIERVSIPEYTVKAGYLQELLRDEMNVFALYNGYLGKVTSKTKYVTLQVCEDDLKVHLYFYPDMKYKLLPNGFYEIVIPQGKQKFYYNNNRNYYDFVVEITNFKIQMTIDQLKALNPNDKPVKVWVDYIGLESQVNNEIDISDLRPLDQARDNFTYKSQQSKIYGRKVTFKYIDPVEIQNNIDRELDLFFESIISIFGPGGSGKTYHIKNDLKPKFIASYQNIPSRQAGGNTLHKTFLLNKLSKFYTYNYKFTDETVWVDEGGQNPKWVWGVMFALHKVYNTKFIISGDHNQLPPYNEIIDYKSYFFSKLLDKGLNYKVNGLTFSQRPNQRYDEAVKMFVNSILECVTNIYKCDRFVIDNKFCPNITCHYTFTLNCRDAINEAMLKSKGYKFDPPSVGLRVVAIEACKKYDVPKRAMFNVIQTKFCNYPQYRSLATVTLRCFFPEEYVVELPLDLFIKNFIPGYAKTIDSCQSLTIKEPMAVYEINRILKKPSARERLYTVCTRISTMNDLYLYYDRPKDIYVEPTIIKQDNKVSDIPESLIYYPEFDQSQTLLTIIS